MITGEAETCRLDKWLWHARFVKTRALAQALCTSGRVRVNGQLTAKAHLLVRPGDVLTFPLHARIRVIRVLATAPRRGSASLARLLYADLAAAENAAAAATPDGGSASVVATAQRAGGSGRPTKRERRETDRLRQR